MNEWVGEGRKEGRKKRKDRRKDGSYTRALAMKRERGDRFESKLTRLGEESNRDGRQPWMARSSLEWVTG